MSQLEGKRVLVTGGSKGIGAALVRQLSAGGARVAFCGRDPERLARMSESVPGALAIQADVASEDDCKRLVAEAGEKLGGLDALVNNAGIGGSWRTLEELDAAEMEQVWRVNVLGASLCARESLRFFDANRAAGRPGGDIVNISSTSGLKGGARASVYSSSKFALKSLSQCWQAELRPRDIRVILLNPSEIQTNFGGPDEPTDINPKKLVADDVAQAVVAVLSMPDRALIPELTLWATNPFTPDPGAA